MRRNTYDEQTMDIIRTLTDAIGYISEGQPERACMKIGMAIGQLSSQLYEADDGKEIDGMENKEEER